MQSSEFKYTLKDLPINQRPREKMFAAGVEVLNDAELLAILIQKGTRNQTALDVAYVLLSKFGSLVGLQNVGIRELLKTHGIGFAKACQIKAAFELSKRLREEIPASRTQISSAKDVYALMKNRFLLEKKEYFYILLLDIKNKLLQECMISQGTLTASIVHPREVFNAAIKESAASIIMIHNHPSGDPKPSQEDIDITRQIRQAGQIMGIKVLDHVIVGHTTYFSFAETISD